MFCQMLEERRVFLAVVTGQVFYEGIHGGQFDNRASLDGLLKFLHPMVECTMPVAMIC